MNTFVPKRRGRGEDLYGWSRHIANAILAFLLLWGSLSLGKILAGAVMAWVHS